MHFSTQSLTESMVSGIIYENLIKCFIVGGGESLISMNDVCGVSDELEGDPHDSRRGLIDVDLAEEVARTFGALSDSTRVRLISALSTSECCVSELAALLDMTSSAVSHQLRVLRDLRVVKGRRQGRRVFYSLDDDHVLNMYAYGLRHALHS